MQQEGKPRFLKFHQGSVRGVAFSPRDRYLFCSGAYDGKVNLYSALRMELLMCYQITTMTLARNVNAVRFTSDGSRILAATTARRLAVVDVERGEQLLAYDNCAFSGRDRTGLAADPICPNMAVSVAVNGKGLTLLDLRMPLPLDFVYDHIKRTGWILREVQNPECIAGHMYRMGILSLLIDDHEGIDKNRCIKIALVHDLAECIVGDITPKCGVDPVVKHRQEDEAMQKLAQLAGTAGNELYKLYKEYEEQQTPEAKLVKELDRFDMVLQAFEYEKLEERPHELEEFFESTRGKFSHPLVTRLVEELYKQRATFEDVKK